MQRDRFNKLVAEALDRLPTRFRRRIENVAVVVEDLPAQPPADDRKLLMGVFEGVPATERSVWNLPGAPNRIVLYQKNIEAVCSSEDEVREQVRLTVLHELGHYFGMTEDELRDI